MGKNPTAVRMWCVPELADEMKKATGTDWYKKFQEARNDEFKNLFE